MLPALSQICTLHAPLEKDVEDYAAGHVEAIELWLGKVEGWLKDRKPSELKELLAKHGIAAPVATFRIIDQDAEQIATSNSPVSRYCALSTGS